MKIKQKERGGCIRVTKEIFFIIHHHYMDGLDQHIGSEISSLALKFPPSIIRTVN